MSGSESMGLSFSCRCLTSTLPLLLTDVSRTSIMLLSTTSRHLRTYIQLRLAAPSDILSCHPSTSLPVDSPFLLQLLLTTVTISRTIHIP